MDTKLLWTVFLTIFVAELGDKTQLATLLYASDAPHARLTVFAGAALALVTTSAIGVLAGSWIAQWIDARTMGWIAGLGFIAVGLWTIARASS